MVQKKCQKWPRKAKSVKRSSSTGPESQIQTCFFQWLALQDKALFDLTFSVPNSGLRSKVEGARQVAMGLKAGVPDIFMAVPTRAHPGLFIELKYGSNKPTEKQLKVMKSLSDAGYKCVVCYSFEEAVEAVKDYLKDTPYVRPRPTTFTYSSPNAPGNGLALPRC